jgi:hypothetical protein
VEPRTPEGYEECLKMGSRWVHLRLCLTCGHDQHLYLRVSDGATQAIPLVPQTAADFNAA